MPTSMCLSSSRRQSDLAEASPYGRSPTGLAAECGEGRSGGLDTEASQISRGLFDAAARFDSRRLPELFAGLERDAGSFPVQYLGANVPQAWSSAAVVHLIRMFAGLEADAPHHTLRLRPALPPWLGDLHLDNLTVGDASVNLHITRHPDGTHSLDIGEHHGELDVILDSNTSDNRREPPASSP